jgi:GntR family transcriptional regulator
MATQAIRFPKIQPADPVPVWKQIEEGVRRLVAGGQLGPGSLVPSVRDLAVELRVNPATVAKAYQGLVTEGLLQMRRGEGTFVADRLPARSGARAERAIRDAAGRFAAAALTAGLSAKEAHEALSEALAELTGKGDRQ